jgi:hypothetical protein
MYQLVHVLLSGPRRALLSRSTSLCRLSSCQLHHLLLLLLKQLLMMKTLLTSRPTLLLLAEPELGIEEVLLLLSGPMWRLLHMLLDVLTTTSTSSQPVAQ